MSSTQPKQPGHRSTIEYVLRRGGVVPEDAPRQARGGSRGHGDDEFVLGKHLARGGMGDIHSARQHALGRDVAIKMLRPDHQNRDAARELLREARVAGFLEHPNIVPVHMVGTDEEGRPFIVMKRVEGDSWDLMLERGHRTPMWLQAQVDVLVQVCRAIVFAHAKGVIHRDLKPSNVMVGRFGEVYVVDWGVAAALRDDVGLPDLPRADLAASAIGTPAYMAPEVASNRKARIDERSDVYLLGGMLYEVLSGQPPHGTGSQRDQMVHARSGVLPPMPSHAPRYLVQVCRKALHMDPAERYADASAFLDALRQFKDYRASMVVSDTALAAFARLQSLATHTLAGSGDMDATISAAFSECRLGFRQALRLWPENRDASEGLQQCIELMIQHELGAGRVDSASQLLQELPRHSATLPKAVIHAEQERGETVSPATPEEAIATPGLGDRARSEAALVVAALYAVGSAATLLTGADEATLWPLTGVGLFGVVALVLSLMGWTRRAQLLSTEADRRLAGLALIAVFEGALAFAGGSLAGLDYAQVTSVGLLLSAGTWVGVGVAADPGLILPAFVYLGGAAASSVAPVQAPEILGLTLVLATLALVPIWRGRARAAAPDTKRVR